MEQDMSSMLQMYHANLAARLHPSVAQSAAVGHYPTLSFWPHGPSMGPLGQNTISLHRPAMASLLGHKTVNFGHKNDEFTTSKAIEFGAKVGKQIRNTEDSCGGSSASNSSDTNGSDTNSGDEVDVEVIDTPESVEPKSASNLSFSISNLLGGSSPKCSRQSKCCSPTGSSKSTSGISSSSDTDQTPMAFPAGNGISHMHFAQMQAMANSPYRQFKSEPMIQNGAVHKHSHSTCGHGHGQGPEFKCEICGKCFKHVRMLNRHRRNHSPYKKYKCAYCAKGFNDSFDLKRHVRTHTGVKPYKCQYCEKSFTQRCSLESHQDKIHGIKCTMPYKKRREKIYVCEDCGFSTGDVREHYKHAREAHAMNGHAISQASVELANVIKTEAH